jgi:hypothetical protein
MKKLKVGQKIGIYEIFEIDEIWKHADKGNFDISSQHIGFVNKNGDVRLFDENDPINPSLYFHNEVRKVGSLIVKKLNQ